MHQAETAIENTFLYEEATRLSITDGLTGLWNRRLFDLRINDVLQRAIRFQEPFGLMLVDLDHFKNVNDRYGHQAGDAVLVELARRLSDATREVDVVTRFGGEEFALILPKTPVQGTLRLAEKVREVVSNEPFAAGNASRACPSKPRSSCRHSTTRRWTASPCRPSTRPTRRSS